MTDAATADTVTLEVLDRWVRLSDARLTTEADRLTALDSAIGDADHGTNMLRGFTAIVAKLDATPPQTVPEFFKAVGMTLVSKVGGASGSLYGTLFLDMGKNAPAAASMSPQEWAHALSAGVAAVVARGHAQPGDKTMIDAFGPALEALDTALAGGATLADAAAAAAAAAEQGSADTEPLVARKGRASYLGERSVGHVDPGSASTALLLRAFADAATGEAA